MNISMINASVTMGQIQKQLDTISNNIANVNTIGYKRRESTFSDLLFQQVNNQIVPSQENGRLTPNGIRVGSGAKIGQTAIRMEQGSLQQTDRLLDVALTEKNQFFQILVDEGDGQQVRYTRDGAFYFSPNATNPDLLNVVTGQGHFVLGNNGPITIPADYKDFFIREDGSISVTMPDDSIIETEQLEIVQVDKPQMLIQAGENAFRLPEDLAAQGYNQADILNVIAPNEAKVKQKFIEMSNVNMGIEMTELIAAQRSYQFNARSISMADQMMGLVNTIRG